MTAPATVAPLWVAQVELGRPLTVEAVLGERRPAHEGARLWVRLHGDPVGFVDLPLATLASADLVAETVWAAFEAEILHHLEGDGVRPVGPLTGSGLGDSGSCVSAARDWYEPISVVVATKDRSVQLGDVLCSLQRCVYQSFEVIVVDGTLGGATREVFDDIVGSDARFRYLAEPAPGLSRARNVGMAEARFDYVAFTDDDCHVDPLWLQGLARGFGRGRAVGCVTGMVPSAELDTFSQSYFDRRVWWSASVEPRIHRPERGPGDSPLHPFRMGTYGTGANFALDRALALRLGGFSELLGAGSACRGGGEDGDMFVRVLCSGRSVAYEPAAIVWHRGRATLSELREQMLAYGRGIPVTGLKWVADPVMRPAVVRRLPRAAAYYLMLLWDRGYAGEGDRASMALTELRGMLTGTRDFVRGYRVMRRERRQPATP